MSVSDALDAMWSEVPGCSLVAYADLKSQLVLSTSAMAHPGQEELDALSSAARLVLDDVVSEGAATVWSETNPEASAESAMLMTEAEVRVYLRAPGASSEALICVCSPDSDLDRVVACGRETLTRIQGESE